MGKKKFVSSISILTEFLLKKKSIPQSSFWQNLHLIFFDFSILILIESPPNIS